MVNKTLWIVLILFFVTEVMAISHNTQYGEVNELANSIICKDFCSFTLTFTPTQNVQLPLDLTFNNDAINSAILTINGKEVLNIESYYEQIKTNYTYIICDDKTNYTYPLGDGFGTLIEEEKPCVSSHEEQGTTTTFKKKFTKSAANYEFQAETPYTIIGTGTKSPLSDIKWTLGLGSWQLDPLWDSSWTANGTVTIVGSTSADNLTANVTWSGFNSSFRYIYNWFRNNRSLTVLNMPFEIDARDYSVYQNNGTVYGVTWNSTAGYIDGAYQFDGVDDYINLSSIASQRITNTNKTTVMMWIKPISNCNNAEVLCGIMGSQGTSNGFHWQLWSAGPLNLYLYGLAIDVRTNYNFSQHLNEWHHVAFTYDGTGINAVKVYVDGNLDKTGNGTVLIPTSTTMRIGNTYNSVRIFNGSIDEVLVFNRSLSSQQINALYHNKTYLISSNETTLADFWKVGVTPVDGTTAGTTKNSSEVIILNSPPQINSLVLNSTNVTSNNTLQNITVYSTVTDFEGNSVKVIYNWRLNNKSLTLLNMPFEGGSNATWTKDYSSYGHNGTVNGSIWNSTGGYDGKGAYQFDGVDDYISLGSTASQRITNTNKTTVMAWIKMNSNSNNADQQNGIIGSQGTSNGFHFQTTPQGSIQIYIYGPAADVRTNYNFSQHLNEWHHVAFTYDGTGTNAIKIYVDGNLDKTGNGTALITTSTTIRIGNTYNSIRIFNGSIDEVMIFNRSLGAEEINVIYQNRTDLMVSNELSAGDVWQASATPNDGMQDGVMATSNTLTVTALSSIVDINSLSLLFTNSSFFSTFRFLIVNNDATSKLFNWTFNTSNEIVSSSIETNLTASEDVMVFLEYNYSSGGSKTVIANATNGIDFDAEQKQVIIG